MKSATIAMVLSLLIGCASTTPDMKLANEGYTAIQRGQYGDAEAKLNAALDTNPDNAYAVLNLGVLYERTGRLEEAQSVYRRVLNLNPQILPNQITDPSVQGLTIAQIARENLARLSSETGSARASQKLQ